MTDGMVAWLRGVLDETEREAREALQPTTLLSQFTGEHHREPGWGWSLAMGDLRNTVGAALRPGGGTICDHIARHDPRAVLARVEAERALLALWDADEVPSIGLAYDPSWQVLEHVLRVIAYGHRHDIPGYDLAWAPDGAEVTT